MMLEQVTIDASAWLEILMEDNAYNIEVDAFQ